MLSTVLAASSPAAASGSRGQAEAIELSERNLPRNERCSKRSWGKPWFRLGKWGALAAETACCRMPPRSLSTPYSMAQGTQNFESKAFAAANLQAASARARPREARARPPARTVHVESDRVVGLVHHEGEVPPDSRSELRPLASAQRRGAQLSRQGGGSGGGGGTHRLTCSPATKDKSSVAKGGGGGAGGFRVFVQWIQGRAP